MPLIYMNENYLPCISFNIILTIIDAKILIGSKAMT